jgi:hypothetical protein
VQPQHAGLGGGEGLEVVQQPRHHRGLLQDRREVRLVGRVQAVEHPLDVAADD